MNKLKILTYEHVSTSIAEIMCSHCGKAFEEGEERLMRISIQQNGNNSSTAQISIESIHIEGCIQESQYQKERAYIQQFVLPIRHLPYVISRTHDEQYKWISTNHSLLLKCLQDYDSGQLKFQPGWIFTYREMPSYQLLLPSDAVVPVAKAFYSYEQFKCQFSRLYILDVTVIELDAEKELDLKQYFLEWKKEMEYDCGKYKKTNLKHDWTIWTHLNSLNETNKAEVRFIAFASINDAAVRKLYSQCQLDNDFAWADIFPIDGQMDDTSWSQSLHKWQESLSNEWQFILESIRLKNQTNKTLSAIDNPFTVNILSTTMYGYIENKPILRVNMNIQGSNISNQYYLISTDLKHLWCYEGK